MEPTLEVLNQDGVPLYVWVQWMHRVLRWIGCLALVLLMIGLQASVEWYRTWADQDFKNRFLHRKYERQDHQL